MPPGRGGQHLSRTRAGTVLNLKSSVQETELGKALKTTTRALQRKFGLELIHQQRWYLTEMEERLHRAYPQSPSEVPDDNRWIEPDGGVLSIRDEDDALYPILISEVKSQGTNDERAEKGLSEQAMGNAIERLGKNVIGIRAAMLGEDIVPFVCFGSGVDFADDSYILGRVQTIAMFGRLNTIALYNEGPNGELNRGSFYFGPKRWTIKKMAEVMTEIGSESIDYYLTKYRKKQFRRA